MQPTTRKKEKEKKKGNGEKNVDQKNFGSFLYVWWEERKGLSWGI
jgi:hypothetical protein